MRFPHRFLKSVVAIAAVVLVMTMAESALAVCFEASLVTQMETDGLHIQITLMYWDWAGRCWPNEPAGVDVYRRELGTTSGPLLLVTEEPLPWAALPVGQPVVLGDIVDDGAATNTAYGYVARAVDEQGNAIPGDPDAVLGYATAGEALIGLGELFVAPDCGISFVGWTENCCSACFPNSYIHGAVPSEVQAYFNSGTTLRIYGEFDGITSFTLCNSHWNQVIISRVEEASCVMPVEPVTWGAVKSIYQ